MIRVKIQFSSLNSKSIRSAASIPALCVQYRLYIRNSSPSAEIVKVSNVISILKQWVLATVANRAVTAVARWPSSRRCTGPGVRCRCSFVSQRHQLLAQHHFASHLVLNGHSEFFGGLSRAVRSPQLMGFKPIVVPLCPCLLLFSTLFHFTRSRMLYLTCANCDCHAITTAALVV